MRITERQLRKKIRYILEGGSQSGGVLARLGAAANANPEIKTQLMSMASSAAMDVMSNMIGDSDHDDQEILDEDEPDINERLIREFTILLIGKDK